MTAPRACLLGVLLAAGLPAVARAGGGGEGPAPDRAASCGLLHTQRAILGVAAYVPPDTSRRTAGPDTVVQRPALIPDTTPVVDEDKPTRKTALFTALAIAALTISTLLLYNVRSR